MVMELADCSLDFLLKQNKKKKILFEQKDILTILQQISETLGELHQGLKIAHRDIKPQNILKIKNQYKLCDLGVAKSIESTQFITQNHTFAGTWNYVSPEQKANYINILSYSGEQIPYNAFQADIFSLGLTLYEVITLKPIQSLNNNQEILNEAVQKNLLQSKNAPQHVLEIVAKMLKWKPQDRIKSWEICELIQ